MSAPIHNRQIPKDGWFQIEVTGEHPAGKGRRQVIDETALSSIVNRFTAEKQDAGAAWAGLLVDADHLSHKMDRPTEAFAWLQDLQVRDGQLHARLDLTDLGETAIKNRRYKFFSTEYPPEDLQDLGEGKVRPLRLSGLAFTNRPNNEGALPISNRADSPDEKPTNTTPMKSIAEKLGLSAEATEADILAKIDSLIAANTAMKGKEAEADAAAVMNRFGDRIPEAARPEWKKRLIANRADTEPLMETTFPAKAKARTEPIHNRKGAANPGPVEGQQDDADEERESKRTELVNGIMNRQGTTFGIAWSQARQQRPELFD